MATYTCDEYVRCWGSTWGGGRGSVAHDIWWDLNGFCGMGENYRVVCGNLELDPSDEETEEEFVRLYETDADNIRIVRTEDEEVPVFAGYVIAPADGQQETDVDGTIWVFNDAEDKWEHV